MSKSMARWMLMLMVAGAVAACGDTWRGVKEDTKDNVEATGEAMEDAGEEVQDTVK